MLKAYEVQVLPVLFLYVACAIAQEPGVKATGSGTACLVKCENIPYFGYDSRYHHSLVRILKYSPTDLPSKVT